jgi:hypothetical protein
VRFPAFQFPSHTFISPRGPGAAVGHSGRPAPRMAATSHAAGTEPGWHASAAMRMLLLLLLFPSPVGGQPPLCNDDASFSAGAAAVTTDCCESAAAPPGGSGHRRRLQEQSCAVPTACPSQACATTFTAFFAACEGRLRTMPDIGRYVQLEADCLTAFPIGADGSCVDDPQGLLASYGVSCTMLVTTGPCHEDLSLTGWPVQSRTLMRDICPLACEDVRCGSEGEAPRCQLRAIRSHWTAGDGVTIDAGGCTSAAGTDLVARRVSGPHPAEQQGPGAAPWVALPGARLAQGLTTWRTAADDYGRWELAVIDSATQSLLSEPVTVWVAPTTTQEGVSPELYTEEWGLPVVHIAMDGRRRPTQAKQGATITVRGDVAAGSVHVRGATSSSYAKQSFTLKFESQELGIHEWHGHGHTRGHLILTTTFDDSSYVRQKLIYDTWKAMADFQGAHRLTPQTFFAVVYVNGVYQGLYLGKHCSSTMTDWVWLYIFLLAFLFCSHLT